MKNNRRNFLKLGGLTGFGILGNNFLKGAPQKSTLNFFNNNNRQREQHFNMSGYAAPKLDTVRVGFIGLGMRGPTHLNNMTKLQGVEIKALCDIRSKQANDALKTQGTTL